MKRLLLALAAPVVLASPAGAQVRDTTVKLDAIVAMVGTTPITVYDIERRLGDSIAAFAARRAGVPTPVLQREMAKSALNDLVDEEVLLLKAKEAGVEITDAEVAPRIDAYIRDNVTPRYPSQAAFRQALLDAGYGTPEEYRRTMIAREKRDQTLQAYIQQVRSEKKMAAVVVTEKMVQDKYAEWKANGLPKRPETASWRQMVIAPTPSAANKAAAKAKAESLRAEIRAGADFERIAKRESMDAGTKELGGDLGWRKRGDLPIELERLMFGPFTIKQGEVSQVVESPFGFHLLRIDRSNPPAEVKVRQILIIPKIDSADVVRAKFLADSLVGALRAGAAFDTVARLYHDRAEDAPGLIPQMAIDSLPASYQAGLRGVKKDSVVTFPIPTSLGFDKFVIAEMSTTAEAGEYTYEDLKARIRYQLTGILQTRKYIDQQRKTVYVRVYPERAEEAVRIFATMPGR